MRRLVAVLVGVALTLSGVVAIALATQSPAAADTTAETGAVNWAEAQVGQSTYGYLCLAFVFDAWQYGGGINLRSWVNVPSGYNWNDAYPDNIWSYGFNHGTTGTGQPTTPGALIFFGAGTGGDSGSSPSHVMIYVGNGQAVSSEDYYNGGTVPTIHYETFGSHPRELGWWLPDGTSGGGGGGGGGASGYETAEQANTGSLWSVGANGGSDLHGDWQLGMAPGTSPGIAMLAGGGYEIAFQANTGALWVTGTAGTVNLGLGMAPGTSPAIAGLHGGGYEIAFQANTGSLWTVGSGGGSDQHGDWHMGLAAGSSPSITSLANGGYEVAAQANTGSLWTVGAGGGSNLHGDWSLGMASGTSPAIAGLPGGGYEFAFQANTGSLWTVGSGGGSDQHGDWHMGLAAGTTPCIASTLGGSCAPSSPAIHMNAAPTLGATPHVGSPLSAGAGSWTPADVTYSYQWLIDGGTINGATAATYTPTASDLGRSLSVRVTASKGGFASSSAVSGGAAVQPGALNNTAPPTISGTPKPGSTLLAAPGSWNVSGTSYTYQWLRNGAAIPGATGASYAPNSSDVGTTVSVRVTASKLGYTSGSAVSTGVPVQTAPTPFNQSCPTQATINAHAASVAHLRQQLRRAHGAKKARLRLRLRKAQHALLQVEQASQVCR